MLVLYFLFLLGLFASVSSMFFEREKGFGITTDKKDKGYSRWCTEKEMKKRVKKLWFPLLYRGGFDILLTHSPAYQLNDGLDLPHQGFQVFNTLMDKYHPRFFIHGHVHMSYGRNQKRYDQYNQTHVINAYDRCVFDYEDDNLREHLKR